MDEETVTTISCFSLRDDDSLLSAKDDQPLVVYQCIDDNNTKTPTARIPLAIHIDTMSGLQDGKKPKGKSKVELQALLEEGARENARLRASEAESKEIIAGLRAQLQQGHPLPAPSSVSATRSTANRARNTAAAAPSTLVDTTAHANNDAELAGASKRTAAAMVNAGAVAREETSSSEVQATSSGSESSTPSVCAAESAKLGMEAGKDAFVAITKSLIPPQVLLANDLGIAGAKFVTAAKKGRKARTKTKKRDAAERGEDQKNKRKKG